MLFKVDIGKKVLIGGCFKILKLKIFKRCTYIKNDEVCSTGLNEVCVTRTYE